MNNSQNLEQSVRKSLEEYFRQLGDETPENIWQMVAHCVEKATLETVMQKADGNQTKAAAMLGMTRTTLRKKLLNHQLSK
ncbi:helix-turn-helix domain-containing protein [Brackiella oedipodis]|uniref:helix-turn-helix domain-containing protein n=1 Tax=Brackiella oedipodis TaxID=124225 RepID=UPI00048AC54A|nr:helix-turn-helix domain-containing protein [Brackiella oedipodis]